VSSAGRSALIRGGLLVEPPAYAFLHAFEVRVRLADALLAPLVLERIASLELHLSTAIRFDNCGGCVGLPFGIARSSYVRFGAGATPVCGDTKGVAATIRELLARLIRHALQLHSRAECQAVRA